MKPAILGLSAILSGCAVATKAPVAQAGSVMPMPDSLKWVRNSAEYRVAVLQTYRLAVHRIEQIAPDSASGRWAVIVDADETVISNSQYQKERLARGLAYSDESWAAWVHRGEAPPLPGAIPFLRRVRELGGKVVVVTDRSEGACADTRANFDKYDIPFDIMLCRPQGESGKEERFERIERGSALPGVPPLRVVLWVGDNIRDFPGLDQGARFLPEEALSAFGDRFFILPNPMYGSWESNAQR